MVRRKNPKPRKMSLNKNNIIRFKRKRSRCRCLRTQGGQNKTKKFQNRRNQKKKVCFSKVINQIKKHIFKQRPDTVKDAVHIAMKTAHNFKDKMGQPRIVSISKRGGVLPLIPIFAGLSALGALSGGAAGIAKAVNDARSAKQQLDESHRHNKTMESIAMGKGMYLKPYKKGMGLFLKPYH